MPRANAVLKQAQWAESLRAGERLRLHKPPSRRTLVIAAVAAAAAMTALVWGEANTYELTVFAVGIVLVSVFHWAVAANSCVQLSEDHCHFWSGLGRERRVLYGDLIAVSCQKEFGWLAVRACAAPPVRGRGPKWSALLITPADNVFVAQTVAEGLARRGALERRSEGLWARVTEADLPPVPWYL